jgi:hypothetical protein
MIKDYGRIWKHGINSMITTPDNKYLFVCSENGELKQICLEQRIVVHEYRTVYNNWIFGMQTTRDSKYLITGSSDGRIKRISIENRAVD